MTTRAISLVTITIALAAAACGGDPDARTGKAAPPPTTSQTPASSATIRPDEPAQTRSPGVPALLDFTARTVDGESFRGAELAGKPVLLWFWAPWCPVCRGQLSMVEDLAEEYAGRVAVVGVGSLDSADAIADFAAGTAVTQITDEDGSVWRRFSVTEQSSFVLLDVRGEPVLRTGYADDDAVPGAVESTVE
ncbi:MAG TPA: redoxin domain-containing protein [Nocardioidaceae bacterium]|nr:redoxin domain-containing protein [Nocardioidaceae bacterium]